MISGGSGASWVEAAAAANERWAGQMITIQSGSHFTGPVSVSSAWAETVLQVAALSRLSAAGSGSQGPHPPREPIRPGTGGTSEDSELEKFRFFKLFGKTDPRGARTLIHFLFFFSKSQGSMKFKDGRTKVLFVTFIIRQQLLPVSLLTKLLHTATSFQSWLIMIWIKKKLSTQNYKKSDFEHVTYQIPSGLWLYQIVSVNRTNLCL